MVTCSETLSFQLVLKLPGAITFVKSLYSYKDNYLQNLGSEITAQDSEKLSCCSLR